MTRVQIIGQQVEVEVLGWHKLWSFKDRFEIPLGHVLSISRLEEGQALGGLRLPGTYLPGVIRAGSYLKGREWVFWDVCDRKKALVIALQEERYVALIVEVADPDETLGLLRARMRR